MGNDWFENEAGLDVAQILGLEGFRKDSLLAAIGERLGTLQASGKELNLEQETLVAVEALERDVSDGGFAKFFQSSTRHVPFVVKSLERIGSREAKGLAKEAVSLLKIPAAALDEPETLSKAVRAAVARHEIEIRLNDLDSDFYVLEEDLGTLLWDYVQKHGEALSA